MEEKIMHLLITEDDMALAQGLQRALQEKNRQVLCCKNIQETRQHLQQNKTDLLILDVNLPDGSGFDLLQEIRRTSDLPVILLTANDLEMDIVSGLEQGANYKAVQSGGTPGAGKHPASEPDGADAERKRKKYTDLGGQYLEV